MYVDLPVGIGDPIDVFHRPRHAAPRMCHRAVGKGLSAGAGSVRAAGTVRSSVRSGGRSAQRPARAAAATEATQRPVGEPPVDPASRRSCTAACPSGSPPSLLEPPDSEGPAGSARAPQPSAGTIRTADHQRNCGDVPHQAVPQQAVPLARHAHAAAHLRVRVSMVGEASVRTRSPWVTLLPVPGSRRSGVHAQGLPAPDAQQRGASPVLGGRSALPGCCPEMSRYFRAVCTPFLGEAVICRRTDPGGSRRCSTLIVSARPAGTGPRLLRPTRNSPRRSP
jgi:hypothetical protein